MLRGDDDDDDDDTESGAEYNETDSTVVDDGSIELSTLFSGGSRTVTGGSRTVTGGSRTVTASESMSRQGAAKVAARLSSGPPSLRPRPRPRLLRRRRLRHHRRCLHRPLPSRR
eukprot:2520910-Prymnesium_polylepis.2